MDKNCHKIDRKAADQEGLAIIIKDEWICMMKLLHIIIKSICEYKRNTRRNIHDNNKLWQKAK